MPQQCVFTNPADGSTYTWRVNPPWDGITQPAQKQRQITRTANTANVGTTRQQGDDGPYVLHWETLIFHQEQQIALFHWYQLCKTQTIYLTDWNGNQYEGQLITVGDQWIGASGGPGDTNARVGYSKMITEFDVWRFISGVEASAGLLP